MFSRYFKIILSLIFVITSGCGLRLGEKNKTEKVAELKTASCLDSSINSFKTFANGDATEEQVSDAMVCLQETLKDFKTNVRGKNPEGYSAEELANFISKQFLKENSATASSGLLGEVMKLKVVLVGGTTQILTKNEVNGLIDVIARLQHELPKLAPHMKIILMKWAPDADATSRETKFLKAKLALETLMNRVGNLLGSTQRNYEISDLFDLIIEIMKISKTNSDTLNKVINAKLLILKAKKTFIGGDTALKGKEWTPFMRTVSEALAQFLRYKYFYDNLSEKQISEKWQVHQKVAKDVVDLIKDLLTFKESHLFSTEELSDLILTAQQLKYLNSQPDQKKFTQKGLNSLFKSLWNNILIYPENRLSKKSLPGFNLEALSVLATEISLFIDNKISIADVFAAKQEYSKEELIAALSARSNNIGMQEVIRALSSKGLMNFNSEGYLKILTESNGRYHFDDLDKANISRSLARIIIRSFANDQERVNTLNGVTLEEAQFGFDQLKDMILNIELVAPENAETFIANRFHESNLFISVGNGDTLASFTEIDHLILHIMSGVVRAKSLEKISLEKCVKSIREYIGNSEFDQDCLLDLYLNEDKSFAEMPEFIKMKNSQNDSNAFVKVSPEDNKKYYLALLTAAGHVPNDNKIVYLRDAGLFPHVVQYVEMIFFTHDANGNGILEKEEAIKAYPVFAETIKLLKNTSFFKDLDDADFLGAFIWLLKKGTPFPVGTMKKFAKDYECNLKNDSKTCTYDWTLSSGRVDIGKIFMLIAGLTKPKPPEATAPVPAPPAANN